MPATYEKIQSNTLSSATNTISFTSVSQSYTDLRIVFSGTTVDGSTLTCRFNSDSSGNYSFTDIITEGTTASANVTTNVSSFVIHYNGLSTTHPTYVPIDIFSYTGSTYKSALFGWHADRDGSGYIKYSAGTWRSTSAINAITFSSNGNFAVGTTISIYGILKA